MQHTYTYQRTRFNLAASLLSVVALLSCGDEKDGEKAGVSVKNPCAHELSGQCGQACEETSECPSGQFCEGGQCGAECTTAGGQCIGTCTAVGECDGTLVATVDVPVSGDKQPIVGADDDDDTTPGNDNKCIEVVSGFEGVTPTVLIVVDQSGSMSERFEGQRNRWDTVRDTLIDPEEGLISRLQGGVRFGLSLYTSVNPQGADSTVFDVCPQLTNTPIALNGFEQIRSTFAGAEPPSGGHTPTGESLDAATDTLLAVQEEGPKAIILATDGDPDNCMDGDANARGNDEGRALSMQMSEEAVKRAFAAGIKTYVISVADDASEDHLQTLAELGQGGDANARFYPADSTAQLESAFGNIVGSVRSCSYNLNGSVPEDHAMNGTVTLGGEALGFNDPNGWTIVGTDRVEIQGSACERLLASDDIVNISFPCVQQIDGPK